MVRPIPCLLLAAALGGLLPAQAGLSVVSALGTPPPFALSEVLTIQVNGEPLRPLTLMAGPPAAGGIAIPGIAGTLWLDPLALTAFGGWDGLGLFGAPSLTAQTGSQGIFSVTFSLPPVPQGLLVCGGSFQLQALVAQAPVGGVALELSNVAVIAIQEPTPVTLAASPFSLTSWSEGSSVPLVISGSFPGSSTVIPTVTFASLRTGAAATGTVIGISPTQVDVLTPPFLGAPTAPPSNHVGPVLVTVDFEVSGIYCTFTGNGVASAGSASPAAADFLQIESTVFPALAAISPRGLSATPNGSVPSPALTLSGTGFLNGARVRFRNQGTTAIIEQPVVTVDASATQITLDPPASLVPGVYDVIVVNPDSHVSPTSSPSTDFVFWPFTPGDVTVTGVSILGGSGNEVVEGSGSFDLLVTGTCPAIGAYSALDPLFGPTRFRLGSDLGANPATTSLDLGALAPMITAPGVWQIVISGVSSVPPGLIMPFALSSGGTSNAGPKHLQVIPSAPINPAQAPHLDYLTLQATSSPEPTNVVHYLAAAPPRVFGIAPNSCARVDGGQLLAVVGADILSNDAVLPSTAAHLGPRLELVDPQGLLPDVPLGFDSVTSNGTLVVAMTPDLTPWLGSPGFTLPYRMDLRVTNPDGQASDTTLFFDDYFAYPSLVDPAAPNPFDPIAPPTPLPTTQVGPGGVTQPIVYSFNDDVVLDVGVTLHAQGTSPLIIRSRGNIVIRGAIDVSGGTVTAPPFPHPAGAGRGAQALQPMGLGAALATTGNPGVNPIDALTGIPFIKPAGGGFHAAQGSGGGGGGMYANVGARGNFGLASGAVPILGGVGGLGLDLNLPLLPIPPLTAETDAPFFYPPGGGGGAAGGIGLEPPLNPGANMSFVGFNGAGGNGGGGIALIADGLILLQGTLRADGAPGISGSPAQLGSFAGGGGGGGGGGGILLQSIQGIVISSSALVSAQGAPGGSGGAPGVGDGGAGSEGMIRYALPLDTTWPIVSLVITAASQPPADATPYVAP